MLGTYIQYVYCAQHANFLYEQNTKMTYAVAKLCSIKQSTLREMLYLIMQYTRFEILFPV